MNVSKPTTDIVLSFNAGSSELKFGLFRFDAHGEHLLASGAVSHIARPRSRAKLDAGLVHIDRPCAIASFAEAVTAALALLKECDLPTAAVVGHCVAYGGQAHVLPTLVDELLVSALKELMSFTPVQLFSQIVAIEAALRLLPGVPHVACFDSAFHALRHEQLERYAIPSDARSRSACRYGSHGLSFEFVMSSLGAFPPNRVIIAHLDCDSSLVAVREGRSIDTTAGFRPPDATGDDNAEAHVAALRFGYAVRKIIGAYFAALGGLDLLVFTGRVGEHSVSVRQEACANLCALGIDLDSDKNSRNECNINSGRVSVLIVPADEQRMIALHARAALHGQHNSPAPGSPIVGSDQRSALAGSSSQDRGGEALSYSESITASTATDLRDAFPSA